MRINYGAEPETNIFKVGDQNDSERNLRAEESAVTDAPLAEAFATMHGRV